MTRSALRPAMPPVNDISSGSGDASAESNGTNMKGRVDKLRGSRAALLMMETVLFLRGLRPVFLVRRTRATFTVVQVSRLRQQQQQRRRRRRRHIGDIAAQQPTPHDDDDALPRKHATGQIQKCPHF